MDNEKPVLLIERLTVITVVFAFFSSPRYQHIFFVHESRIMHQFILPFLSRFPGGKFTKLNNVDFTGMFYEYMEQACSYVNDAILNKNRNNLYIHLSLKFCNEDEYLMVIEKELLNRYTAPRVKTYVILKKVAEKYRNVTFFPLDNEDIPSAFSPPFSLKGICRIPRWISAINEMKKTFLEVSGFLGFPVLIAGVCLKILKRGIATYSPEKKDYTYGIDMQRNGLVGERGLDTETNTFFLYDDHDFAPEKILHVIRNGHRLEENARHIFTRYKCPFIELDSLKVPLNYLIKRVIRDFFIKSSISTFRYTIGHTKRYYCILPALSTMKMTMDEEINCLYTSIRVFIARDDYSPFHIVRTLIARASGNYTVGFQWADLYNHNSSFSHFVFDRYALFGEFYEGFHKKALMHSKPIIIGAGIYGSDIVFHLKKEGYYPEKYREKKEKYKIIAIMGSAFEDETSITRGPAIRFHEEVLELTDGYPGIVRILKPKGDYLDTELTEMMERRSNVYLEKELTTPRFLLVPDVIIVQSNSTVGIEALMAGKKVLYYSFVTPPQYQIYSKYGIPLVAFTREDLKRSLDCILNENTYLNADVLRNIQYVHGFKFDGKVAERFRIMCKELAEPGKNTHEAR